jgi:hypothetical protein
MMRMMIIMLIVVMMVMAMTKPTTAPDTPPKARAPRAPTHPVLQVVLLGHEPEPCAVGGLLEDDALEGLGAEERKHIRVAGGLPLQRLEVLRPE